MDEKELENIKLLMNNLSQRLESVVVENIKIDQIASFNKIILVRSVKAHLFYNFYDRLRKMNPDMEIYLIGDTNDFKELVQRKDYNTRLLMHENRLGRNDAERFLEVIPIDEMDAICYFTYKVFRSSYLNVVDFCGEVSQDKLPMYGNIIGTEKIFQIIDRNIYLKGMNLVEPIQEWADLLIHS